ILAGKIQQLDARHQHALLAVANRRTVDRLMSTAEATGVYIESIEPSLLALSRAQAHLKDACRDACLIIHLDENAAELGICHGGRLLLDYRPGGHTSPENVAELIAQHLSRLERYLERYHSLPQAPLRHVYLAGDANAIQRAHSNFEKLSQFDVHVLEPRELDLPWCHAADPPSANLGATPGPCI